MRLRGKLLEEKWRVAEAGARRSKETKKFEKKEQISRKRLENFERD